MFDFSIVTNWFDTLLRQTCGLSDFWAILIECVLVGVIVLTAYALICIVLIFMERKVCAYFQCRVGPMRVGPWGIFQVFADVVKMLIKEIFSVDRADKLLYYLAPILVMVASVGTFSFLPFNKGMEVLDFNVGVFIDHRRLVARRDWHLHGRMGLQQQVLGRFGHAWRRAAHLL